MPAGRGNDAERFAAALEQGRTPDSTTDAEFARDLEIVRMLRAAGPAYAPDPDAKARARHRLLAALTADQDVSENAPSAMELTVPIVDRADSPATRSRTKRTGRHELPTRAGRAAGSSRPGTSTRSGRRRMRRAVLTASAALLMIVAIAGGGIFASRDALPGDALYGIKRVAESAGLALTFDDAARAARHLELASTRLAEVEQLVDGPTTADPALVEEAIHDFDTATGKGSNLILGDDETDDPARLADLQAWAADQVSRISTMRSGLPVATRAEADRSIELLDTLRLRAAQLAGRAACKDVPATGDCASDITDPATGKSRSARGGSSEPGSNNAAPGGLVPGLGEGASTSGAAAPTGSSTPTPTSQPAIAVPLPLPLLPPINLPPLLPGGRGITIGG